MQTPKSAGESRRLFSDLAASPPGTTHASDVGGVTFAWVPKLVSDDLFDAVVESLDGHVDLAMLTAGEIRDLLRHGMADVRARLWARVPEDLFEQVRTAVCIHAADEQALFSALQIKPDLEPECELAESACDEAPPRSKRTGRRSPITAAEEVMDRLCPSGDELVRARLEAVFMEFVERAYGTDRRRRFRFPYLLTVDHRHEVRDTLADMDPRFNGYARWLSRHFCKFVRTGALSATADDWSDLLSEGTAQLWWQFLRVWQDKGDPATLIWDLRWDLDVRKLDAASVETLARAVAKRRGTSQRMRADRGSVIAFLNIRKAYQEKRGRPIGEGLRTLEGLQLAARAYASYRRGRLCTAVRQGGTMMMRPPAVEDVVHVWLDGEAAARHPVWRSRSLDETLGGPDGGTSLGAALADGHSQRTIGPDEAEFYEATLQHVRASAGDLHYWYLVHCVAGTTPRKMWMSPSEFVAAYELCGTWELDQIREELEPVIHAWLARHGIEIDTAALLTPRPVGDRGLWGRSAKEINAHTEHIDRDHDADGTGPWGGKPRDDVAVHAVTRDEAAQHARRLAVEHRARVERWILRYHKFATLQVTDWLRTAVEKIVDCPVRAEALCKRILNGEATRTVFPDTDERELLAGYMRSQLHEHETHSRGELEALDLWWNKAYEEAYAEVARRALRANLQLSGARYEVLTIRLAVKIAYSWTLDWLRGGDAGAKRTPAPEIADRVEDPNEIFDSQEAAAFGMSVVPADRT